MTVVADQQDPLVLLGEAHGLAVHLGHQRARGVDGAQVALGGLLDDGRGHAVRGEHGQGALGHLVQLVDEHHAALGQGVHDVPVVDDLLAHVHGGAVVLEGLLDGDDGAVHAGAVATGGGQQHALLTGHGRGRLHLLTGTTNARDLRHPEADGGRTGGDGGSGHALHAIGRDADRARASPRAQRDVTSAAVWERPTTGEPSARAARTRPRRATHSSARASSRPAASTIQPRVVRVWG